MKVNPFIQEIIAKRLLEENTSQKEPSGRLSASRLGWPLQWQMLHYHKVPQAPVDEYTLRKFARGNDVEERVVKWIGASKTQVPVTYRGVMGFADVIPDELGYPVEIKSVTNRAFQYKQVEGPSRGHKLQGELYAKGLGVNTYAVAYVASDDYRVLCFEEEVGSEVDKVINRYDAQVKIGTIPVFVAEEGWQELKGYNPYYEWMKLTQEQIDEKLKSLKK